MGPGSPLRARIMQNLEGFAGGFCGRVCIVAYRTPKVLQNFGLFRPCKFFSQYSVFLPFIPVSAIWRSGSLPEALGGLSLLCPPQRRGCSCIVGELKNGGPPPSGSEWVGFLHLVSVYFVCLVCLPIFLLGCLSGCVCVSLSLYLSLCLSVSISLSISVCLCICLFLCLFACLSVCRSVGLSVCRSVGLSVCRSVWNSLPLFLSQFSLSHRK